MRQRGTRLTNARTGLVFAFSSRGNRELKAWSARPEAIELLAALPAITKQGVVARIETSEIARDRRQRWATLYAPVRIGGDLRIARVVAHDAGGGLFLYDLQNSEILESTSPAGAGLDSGGIPAAKAGATPTHLTLAQLREAVKHDPRPEWRMRAAPDAAPDTPDFDVDAVVETISARWVNAPPIRTVERAEDLPEPIVRIFRRMGSDGSDVRGVYSLLDNTVYLVRANLRDRLDVETTLFHEVLGHHGLRLVFGDDTPRQVRRLVNAIGGWGGILRYARAHDIDLSAYQALRRDDRLSEAQQAAVLFDELLAHMAERQNRLPPTLRQRLVEFFGAIRAWLRRHGFTTLAGQVTDAELAHLLRRARRAVEGDARALAPSLRAAGGARFKVAPAFDAEPFRRWFGRSQVVNPDGSPKVVYHGTAEAFWAFDKGRLAASTGHMTAPLGFFFAEDRAKAQRYAEKAADGVPADERVIDAVLAIRNPKAMTLDALMAIESQDEARALRARLQRQGFDGIHLPEIGQWIAFEPTQVKSASENRGTFDPGNADIRFSRRGRPSRSAAAAAAASTGWRTHPGSKARSSRGTT